MVFVCSNEKIPSLINSFLFVSHLYTLLSPLLMKLFLQLSWELEHLAHRENEFKEIYLVLSNQCKKYSCDLLDLCRSTEEVIAVLNRRSESECDDEEYNAEEDKLTLSRLKMALKYEQKQVRKLTCI